MVDIEEEEERTLSTSASVEPPVHSTAPSTQHDEMRCDAIESQLPLASSFSFHSFIQLNSTQLNSNSN